MTDYATLDIQAMAASFLEWYAKLSVIPGALPDPSDILGLDSMTLPDPEFQRLASALVFAFRPILPGVALDSRRALSDVRVAVVAALIAWQLKGKQKP